MKIFLIILVTLFYWFITTVITRNIAKKHRQDMLFNLPGNYRNFDKYLKIKKWKEKIPAKSEFDKTQIKNMESLYLKRFFTEVNRGLVVHTVPFLLTLPLLFVSIRYFLLNLLIVTILNLPSFLILYYNSLKFRRILIKHKII